MSTPLNRCGKNSVVIFDHYFGKYINNGIQFLDMVKGHVTLVKGETILSELGWVKYKKGIVGVNDVLEDVNEGRPPNLALDMDDFEPSGWYPVEVQHAILQSITKRFGDGNPEIVREVGAHGVKKIGQFKFVLRFMKVKRIAEKMADNLMVLYRTTDLTMEDTGEFSIVITIKGFPDDPVYLNLLQGGIEQLFTYINIKSFTITPTKCEPTGDIGCCRYDMVWE